MASITTATSGLASATGTWTGGVVPGTTFAGTRTTTAAGFALGATTIAISATGAQAITAGKRLKFAGDPNTYRVSTGLAGSTAGNVIIDAPGLLVAIPAVGTTVSCDMVDDQVIVDHPGTNILGTSTLYKLNGAASAGATSIPVNTGTGTIVAGECIQIEHPIGVDEDGNTVYDPTYYKVSTGITGAGTLVLATGLTYAVASGVQVINRGHVLEIGAEHCFGNDVSSATATSNGIVVKGTIKASRSASSRLTLRGSMVPASGGTIDWGYPGSEPIPSAVTHEIIPNDSATLTTGKHGIVSTTASTGVTWRMCGKLMTRNTRLTGGISAGATSITVDDSVGWATGDRVVIASDTDDPARIQVVVLGVGSTPTWAVPAITNARLAGCRVGNLSSNVLIRSQGATTPAACGMGCSGTDTTSTYRVQDVAASNVGCSTGWVGVNGAPYFQRSFSIEQTVSSGPAMIRRPACEGTNGTAAPGIILSGPSLVRHKCTDAAIVTINSGAGALYFTQGAASDFQGIIYRTNLYAFESAFSEGASSSTATGEWWCGNDVIRCSPALGVTVDGAIMRTPSAGILQLGNTPSGGVRITNSTLNAIRLVRAGGPSVIYSAELSNCTISAGALAGSNTTGTSQPNKRSAITLVAVNGVATDNRKVGYHQTTVTDTATRQRSTYAVKIQPQVANTPVTYTFTLPAVSGVAQTIKGSLRFDATYGTATPPIITLSGQGVSETHTCAATADAWDDFSFSFTPISTGDITATVTVQSASTSGFAWLDGIFHPPIGAGSVRHFGYLWKLQAAQEVDPSITVSEATALAYPVSVNHGTSTITVSAVATARQVYEACMADLVQTANQSTAKHISTTDAGATFSTTYTVAFSGSGAITGIYTDATGTHVQITATLPASGCRVQLYNLTDATELDNSVISGTSYSFPVTYTANKALRLSVAKQAGASAKVVQVVFATLTSAGAVFTVPSVDDVAYNANGIDGSAVTGITWDAPNVDIDISDPDGRVPWADIYASYVANLMTASGIAAFAGKVIARDSLNYQFDNAIVFNNDGAAGVVVGGDGFGGRADGSYMGGTGNIQFDNGRAYLAAASIPSAASVATAVRSELAPELAAAVQARDMAEADVVFAPGGTPGTGVLAYHRRGTGDDLIPPKAVVGTSQTQASGATQ